ncbi:hypothetical protein L211DRAFT_284879 [Terfezia boudieri ATCC MYA-4762]|uniref:Uncharacterized protein n=1 Tax=Terfezia boudieri ATCC MYA-4762 TaxID=1051890 RepID=A0A3N4LRR6_9PEZI|nr:hypothetical protein L211DRAFT_284879 [Terfezia boudieri ATCC MYA-4762]
MLQLAYVTATCIWFPNIPTLRLVSFNSSEHFRVCPIPSTRIFHWLPADSNHSLAFFFSHLALYVVFLLLPCRPTPLTLQ